MNFSSEEVVLCNISFACQALPSTSSSKLVLSHKSKLGEAGSCPNFGEVPLYKTCLSLLFKLSWAFSSSISLFFHITICSKLSTFSESRLDFFRSIVIYYLSSLSILNFGPHSSCALRFRALLTQIYLCWKQDHYPHPRSELTPNNLFQHIQFDLKPSSDQTNDRSFNLIT